MNTKLKILSLALGAIAVSSPAYATADIRRPALPNFEELLTAPKVTYKEDVVQISSWRDNWFVGVNGGASSFLGTPLGCEDLWGRIKPHFGAYVGKWFTPKVGTRINFTGFQIKNGDLVSQDYWGAHADMMWNALGDKSRFGVVPFVGLGLLHNADSGASPFTLNYGVMGTYGLTQRLKLTLEISNATTFNNFDGIGSSKFGGDNLLAVSAGLSFTIGRNGFKKVVDADPVLADNARLRDLANSLYHINTQLHRQVSNDDRVIAEMKKILEIEGLLSRYGSRLGALAGDDNFGNGVNDYSGLNSLRARLKGHQNVLDNIANSKAKSKKRNNKTEDVDEALADDLASDLFSDASFVDGADGENDEVSDGIIDNGENLHDTDYLALIAAGKKCIGSPILFFFKIGTTNLTDPSQLVNLDEIARVVSQYNLAVRISGAADNATGNDEINNSLGGNRASYISNELQKRGIQPASITTFNDGGIDRLNPVEANRHTRIELLFKN